MPKTIRTGFFLIILFLLLFLFCFPPDLHTLQTEKYQVFFSPGGGIAPQLIALINNSKKSIKLAIYSLTSKKLALALEAAHKRGVVVKIIADSSRFSDEESQVKFLIEKGLEVRLKKGLGKNGIMHHKFAIFDETTVVTGSYNWTNMAEYYNYENTVFIENAKTVKNFSREFDRLFQKD